jgi:hypothetical protein
MPTADGAIGTGRHGSVPGSGGVGPPFSEAWASRFSEVGFRSSRVHRPAPEHTPDRAPSSH